MQRIMPYLLVGAGGFIGCNLRFLVGHWVAANFGSRFPFSTFFINIAGSFLLGVIGTLTADRLIPHPDECRLLLGVGFCGGFTTFSTFEFESQALLRDGEFYFAALNFGLSPLLGYFAVRLGVIFAQSWRG